MLINASELYHLLAKSHCYIFFLFSFYLSVACTLLRVKVLSYRYIKPNIFLSVFVCVCVCQCFFVPYARLQFCVNLDQIWHMASLYRLVMMGWLASSARFRMLALRAPSVYAAANRWRAPSGHLELAASNRNGSSAVCARCNRAP